MAKQLYLEGFAPPRKSSTSKRSHHAKRADLVLVQALEAHSLNDLQQTYDTLKAMNNPDLETAKNLIGGIIAYHLARDSKQESLF